MRVLVFVSLVMCAACGNWSNEDLVYMSALPRSEDLRSELTAATNQQPLSVGDMSPTYDKTFNESESFNGWIDGILGGLDTIRKFPPTTREDNKRIWGPYPDEQHPGFEIKVEITRVMDKNYTWSIDMRPKGGEYFAIITGQFTQTTETLRQGIGSMSFDVKAANAKLMQTGKPGDPDKVEVRYATDSDPRQVSIDLILPGQTATVDFNGYADSKAVIRYTVSAAGNPYTTKMQYTAGWNAKTAGRGDWIVLEGLYKDGTGVECWDEGHIVTYVQGYDDAGTRFESGNIASCVEVPTLDPL